MNPVTVMRNYSLETLKKQLATAEEQYRKEAMRDTGMQWGYCMRHNKTPSTTRLCQLQDRIKDLQNRIKEKEREEA